MTVGVPVNVQPGIETALMPDNDGSPASALGLTSRLGLVTRLVEAVVEPVGLRKALPKSRRAKAATAHSSGD